MPPAYVKPYVKRQKNDAADAEAICEAVRRPTMRFVETKTPGQQSCLTLHRTRHLFIRQQTAVINAIRAHLAEFGIVAPVGRQGVEKLLDIVADARDARLPEVARANASLLSAPNCGCSKRRLCNFDRMIMAWGRFSTKPAMVRRTSGRRTGTGNCSGCQRCRPKAIPIRTGLLGMDWTGAEAELERW